MRITIFFLFLTLFAFSCTEKVKVGDECKQLTSQSEDVTNIEQKNLDCLDLNSDGLCISYEGENSYCTVKCGPARGCAAVQCRFDEERDDGTIKEGEVCVDSICYPKKSVCSETNPSGLCSAGTECVAGSCMSVCQANEVFIKGVCTSKLELCSASKKDGLCPEGTVCSNGVCESRGCEAYEGYRCIAPINLKGHTFKNQNICIKESDLSEACKEQNCSGHGKCKLITGGAECVCDNGYEAKENLTCIKTEVVDPCKNMDCSNHGTCQDMNGNPECQCTDGFVQTADKKDCIAQ